MDENELYMQNAKIVYHFLFSRCHSKDIAEDLTQETFLQAYKSLERYNGSCKISVWLCQIAKHLWYQYLQKNSKTVTEPLCEEILPQTGSTETTILARFELLDVLKEMQNLPSQMREVIYLRIIGDLSFKDIGEIVGKSENWARVNFYRGKEKLLKEKTLDENHF
ncbi:MAG: sigma-70 family RNA polymerase sigma factor [Oscillospiraceae bacterium]